MFLNLTLPNVTWTYGARLGEARHSAHPLLGSTSLCYVTAWLFVTFLFCNRHF